jgi:hypothetical protein
MSPKGEHRYRKAFRDLIVSLFGHQEEAELEGDWERFRNERLHAVLAEARANRCDDVHGKYMLEQITVWCHEQALPIALKEPRSGYASDWELQQLFFKKKPRG